MKIKFSHTYVKCISCNNQPVREALLVDVHIVELADLSPSFLEYDTVTINGDHYPLPKRGKYMMLIFAKPQLGLGSNLFTTLRRWTQEKERYYRSGIGSLVEVEYITPPAKENSGERALEHSTSEEGVAKQPLDRKGR